MQGSGIFQMKTVFHSYSSKQTEEFGAQLGKSLKAGDVVALFGDLGAGKTAFTRGLAHGMGFDGEVSSPTFALVHEYPADIPIYHFDMYRITTWDDLYSTGFFDFLETDAYMAIEWSENVYGALPDDTLMIEIERIGENDRLFKMYKKSEEEE